MNEARLKTEALSLGLIKSTSDALTPAAKAQAAYALIMKDTALSQGDYARTADGTANTMKTLQAKMEDAKVALGDALMPAFKGLLAVLKVAIPLLTKLGVFFQNNQDEIKAFAIALGIGSVAWGVYTLVVKRAEIAQKLLNLAQKMNPIGLIVIAVALLAAGLVKLWKSSETFRNIIISVGKAGLTAFAVMIPMIGKVGEAYLKFLLTPLKLVLGALSKLPGVGKYAKAGLELLNKGLDGVSDFADKAAGKAKELIKTLDNVGKAKTKAEKDVDTTNKGGKTTVTDIVDAAALEKAAKAEQKRLDKLKDYAKDVEDIYKDMNDVITEAQEKGQEALETRNERMAEAHERYNETVADLNKQYAESIADAEERAAEQRADAQDRFQKSVTEAKKRFTQAQIQIAKQYNDKAADLELALQNKLRDIQESANTKRAELATEKKLGDLKAKLAEVAAAMAALQAAQAAAAAMATAPVYTPIIPALGGGGSSGGGSSTGGTTTNVTQNFTATAVDTQLVSTATVSAIRFGNVIVPTSPSALASRESGAIGAASIASRYNYYHCIQTRLRAIRKVKGNATSHCQLLVLLSTVRSLEERARHIRYLL
jgi:hypothetical protein